MRISIQKTFQKYAYIYDLDDEFPIRKYPDKTTPLPELRLKISYIQQVGYKECKSGRIKDWLVGIYH